MPNRMHKRGGGVCLMEWKVTRKYDGQTWTRRLSLLCTFILQQYWRSSIIDILGVFFSSVKKQIFVDFYQNNAPIFHRFSLISAVSIILWGVPVSQHCITCCPSLIRFLRVRNDGKESKPPCVCSTGWFLLVKCRRKRLSYMLYFLHLCIHLFTLNLSRTSLMITKSILGINVEVVCFVGGWKCGVCRNWPMIPMFITPPPPSPNTTLYWSFLKLVSSQTISL